MNDERALVRAPARADGTPKEIGQVRDHDPSVALVASVASVASPPILAGRARYGLAGDFVRLVEPHSEADPVALLTQFLVGVGSMIGRGPYFQVEADRHGVNLFAIMVGNTSKGRKGTSWGHVRRLLGLVDQEWAGRVRSGISSGEGIVYEVRDPVSRHGKKGNEVIGDPGETDKRLLLVEPEFTSVLKVATRQGNTVSTVIRDAWDQDRLAPITKNERLCATGPHISIIGHVTRDELLRHLTETDAASGFANRFLWLSVRRSKLLPRGGQLYTEDLEPIVQRIREAVSFSRDVGEVERTEETWEDWENVYAKLSSGRPGLLGAVTSRAEAQVTRLSTLYALLDLSAVILPHHQAAALAVWQYAEDSARNIFGDRLGDPTADALLRALSNSPDGLTRTQIRDLFGRHRAGAEIARALSVLVDQNFARVERTETGGRPAEIWFATCDKSDKSDERGKK